MHSKIQEKDINIKKLARLAKIKLSPHEEVIFQKELSIMIDFIAEISTIQINKKISSIDNSTVFDCCSSEFREDIVISEENNSINFHKEAFSNAPEVQENLFLVPKVIKNL